MTQDRRDALMSAFRTHFGRPPTWIAEAPGRVNLIGEHTDYNDGFVLPVAIDRSALVAAAPGNGIASRVWSINLNAESAFDARNPTPTGAQPWSNYIRGVAWALAQTGRCPGQMDLAVESDVPMGAGLSSSAALEVATAAILSMATEANLPPLELALLAHQAENEFVGVPCGIMDQLVSALGAEDHALLIDCRSRSIEYVRLRLQEQGVELIVVDSGVSRQLAASAYRARRQQCEEAVLALRPHIPRPITHLRDVTPADLAAQGSHLPPILLRRARHVVSENERVSRSVEALSAGRLEELGQLLADSHLSLREDYQVSVFELDLLVDLARRLPGVIGARLTGAGFGGCTVNLVRVEAVGQFERQVVHEYRRRTGRPAQMHLSQASSGVRWGRTARLA
ncbi:MAG: galactokinase [Chloroflexota bacterium]